MGTVLTPVGMICMENKMVGWGLRQSVSFVKSVFQTSTKPLKISFIIIYIYIYIYIYKIDNGGY